MKILNINEKHYSDTADDLWYRISDYYLEKEFCQPEETEYVRSIQELFTLVSKKPGKYDDLIQEITDFLATIRDNIRRGNITIKEQFLAK